MNDGMNNVRFKIAGAALVRCVRARVVNVSSGGCLVETATRLTDGTVGILEIPRDGSHHREAFRVCHSKERQGAVLPFLAGSEFLVLETARSASVRREVAQLERERRRRSLASNGEKSGLNVTPAIVSTQTSQSISAAAVGNTESSAALPVTRADQ